jgi:hypothetical protein
MSRGFVWRKYVADDATEWALRVDADQAIIASRGWASVGAGVPYFPKGGSPRFVVGLSPTTGRTGTARVGTVTCDLWTGAAVDFDVEANDNTTDTMVVTERHQEILRRSP